MAYRLENLVAHSEIVNKQLYIVQNLESEKTYMECFNKNQYKLREANYNNVANALLIEHGKYHLWRMFNPFEIKRGK